MYPLISQIFFIPISPIPVYFIPAYFIEKDIFNIKNAPTLQKRNSNTKALTIGVSFPDQIVPRWKRDRDIMEEYAKTLGVTLKIENAKSDAAKQAAQIDTLISQGINALILLPVDLSAAAELVQKAHKAGIKVVDYDRLIQNSDVDIYISFNGLKVGELQAQYLIKAVPRGNYIIMSGDPRDMNSKLFKDGAMEYIMPLASSGDIKIVADKEVNNWDPKIAYKIVEEALIANNNNIDAVLAPNDAIAGASIEALKAKGLAGKVPVTGQDADLDAVRRIIEGTQLMTVFKDYREEAKISIDIAIKLARGEPIYVYDYIANGKFNVPSVLLSPKAVDKNNIREVLIDSGFYTISEVYNILK
ncbi:MAG: substrate-binding domain-containing protein [Clostridiaceae bacterium]